MARYIVMKYGEKSEAVRLTGLSKDVEDIWTVNLFLLFLKWGCRVATFYRVAIDM